MAGAVFAGEETIHFVVVHGAFPGGVEAERAAEARGDVPEMAEGLAEMPGFDFGVQGLAPVRMAAQKIGDVGAFVLPAEGDFQVHSLVPLVWTCILPRRLRNICPLCRRIRRRCRRCAGSWWTTALFVDQHPAFFGTAGITRPSPGVYSKVTCCVSGNCWSSSKKYLPPRAVTFVGCVSTPRPHRA